MLQTRVLAPSEYPRLQGTEMEAIWPYLPDDAQVIVVEESGESTHPPKIVGTWALYRLMHCEGVWIAPEHRGKAGVARRLVSEMFRIAKAEGARAVNTAALSSEVSGMLEALGGIELQGRHFSVSVPQEGA